MLYRLNDEFTKIEEGKGTMRNMSDELAIELVTTEGEPKKDSGIPLFPKEKLNFSVPEGQSLYARCEKLNGATAMLGVVNFNVPATGSGSADAGDLIDDTLTALDKTWSSQKIQNELNDVTDIDDIKYNIVTNTLEVILSDGTTKSFAGIGTNYFGGFAQTVLWEGNARNVGAYNLSDTIDNYDLLLVKVGTLKTEVIAPAVLKSFRQSTFNPTGEWVATTDANFSESVMNVTRVSENVSGNMQPITKVIGIKGETRDKVLWEGSVAVPTSSTPTTISLLDSIDNYEYVIIEGITNGSTAVKLIDTVPTTALLTNLGTYLCSANYGISNGASMSLQPIDLANKDKLSFAYAIVTASAWGTEILVKKITGVKRK